MSSFSAILPLTRRRWFYDRDGVLSTSKRSDEILGVSVDWTNELASAETVSSVAVTTSGPTVAGAALVSPVWSARVTGVGEITLTATLSTGRKMQRLVRFYAEQHDDAVSDYE